MKDLDLSKLPIQPTILVTGGTSGLGRQTVKNLAALNDDLIVFTGRSQARADEILADVGRKYLGVQARFVQMDLASLHDTQRAFRLLEPQLDGRLDILVCNAGIMCAPPGLSPEYEIQWATNYLGHVLLVQLLIPLLTRTASSYGDARVVNITSEGLIFAPADKGIAFDDLKTKQEYGLGARWKRYGQSKVAQALYTSPLAQQNPALSIIAVHPGVVDTDLVKTLGLADRLLVYATSTVMSPEDGCKNSLWGATAPRKSVENGAYYSPIAEPGKQTRWTKNGDLAEKLWKWTEEVLQPYVA
ncbi:hypothetical protein D0869_05142 [Hortaea werneckii]|uniref:Oxidoreductase n=1 Tax=Hortaea werneckii TaxID=91943 RepID=A0A3M7BNH1_HORWE|nr:hypothetical protein KC334_g405 [Hortaea werneckii]KAI7027399.1 hypothetical protein KC355_g341 [Hortaea werneckii]KAI7202746.1 hypothetical protein KC324_g1589 [Hortaea werneckii]KAI7584545.1 hypothetical protein KC316_g6644 [Hortaea werneckii]KAI7675217.1 hypothetical protein KC318_g1098 [Hortaea werneckii]